MAPAKKSTKSKARKSASGVIEIDLNNVEVRDAYDGDDPRPGFYSFEATALVPHTAQNGNEGFRWTFVLRDDPLYEGWARYVYSNLDPDGTKWKTEEILLALKGGKSVQGTKAAQVKLDVNNEASVTAFLKKAKMVRGRVQRRRDSDDDDPQFELGKIIALDEAKMAARKAALAAADDDEDEDEDGFEDADEFEDADDSDEDEEDDEEDDSDEDEDEEDSDDEGDDEDEDFEDEDDDDEDEEEEPEPPKKSKKATAAKAASKPAKKAASKVTNIADAKSKKTKRK
jgi:hypothetical protein